MPAEAEGQSAERHRLATAASAVSAIAGHVHGLVQVREEDLPAWLTQLTVPAGWQLARVADSGVQPARIAVCGRLPDGGWDGCETLSLFAFTGTPANEVVYNTADCTLRDLDAAEITSCVLATPPLSRMIAVRASGYFATAGLWVWAQYSTYVTGSEIPRQGRMLQQCLFVESSCQAALHSDVVQLGEAVQRGFFAAAGRS